MTIYQNITFNGFCDAFRDCGRNEQFSYDAKKALYEYLDELSNETGEPMELDVIALCCEFAEYASASEAASEYFAYAPDIEADIEAQALEFLQYNTSVIEFDGGIIIAQF